MKARFLALAIVLGVMSSVSVKADTVQIVVGEPRPGQPGNADNGFPFNISNWIVTSQRYQQVYDAAAFGASSMTIHSMAFTVDETVGAAFNSTLDDIQINLSTTTMTVDNLSTTFADNVGADDTIVLNRGSLDLSSAGVNGTFDIVVHFDTPFFYDPALGNLLLDVRNFGAALRHNSTPTMWLVIPYHESLPGMSLAQLGERLVALV